MFQKKLEVPPILISSDGPFVGQAKKTTKELAHDHNEEDLECPSDTAEVDPTPSGTPIPCSRCRAKGIPCNGKKGRACITCKRAKLSCNFSSNKTAAKMKCKFCDQTIY
jgi:hypothetical protein